LQLGAGTGSVYLLRWYWWRINAWSEISCMATALSVTLCLHWEWLSMTLLGRPDFFSGSSTVVFAKTALTSTALTTIVWIIVTMLTKPEPRAVLDSFYRKVRPHVAGWRAVAAAAPDVPETHDLRRNLWCWVLGTVMTYCALFGVGKLLLLHWAPGAVLLLIGAVAAWLISRELARIGRSAAES